MQPIHKGDEQNMTLIDFLLQLLTFALTTLPLFMTNTIFFPFFSQTQSG